MGPDLRQTMIHRVLGTTSVVVRLRSQTGSRPSLTYTLKHCMRGSRGDILVDRHVLPTSLKIGPTP